MLGYIDSTVGLVSYYISANCCDVKYSDGDFDLNGVNLYHPLIDKEVQVPLTFNFNGENVLVTGSNASGKSTFLRNIGISNVMAMTLGFVIAEKYETSFLYLQSAVNLEDSIASGVSYFLAETLAIKRMLEESNVKKLLILDEIFKGTNTIDRISAAYNTLTYLSKRSKVFAATHDIELTKLLSKDFKNYHFEEEILKDDIQFDYLLKEGPATSRNAIEILNIKGYPKEIVEGSKKMAKKLIEDKT
ncbi:MutS-related protein [Anaerosphaera multitolerans]|uniref:DNA mismatch repair proteins mutS family domain-containing protein n=1 Tax=Anaerosphaera multitolerans TaxID=2487351 RepID=A0A437S5Q4_9FIRM|nr:hypothetical protein [Anaerosphaera multitolerans]RVU54339.1 hypothetical protein EF514_07790 [Anaerosphaera multitolerans]